MEINLGPTQNMGWKCPGCQKCYAPYVSECPTCGEPVITVTTPLDFHNVKERCSLCGQLQLPGQIHYCTPVGPFKRDSTGDPNPLLPENTCYICGKNSHPGQMCDGAQIT